MLSEIDLQNETILKEDIYKENTLILKKGCVLNPYLLNKLSNFGIQKYNPVEENSSKFIDIENLEILVLEKNKNIDRTKKILEFAGFTDKKILTLENSKLLISYLTSLSVKFIFIDYSFLTQDLLDEIYLNSKNFSSSIKTIFIMNCNETTDNFSYNTDFQNIKFLYRPLANFYIKALLKLYS